MPARGRISELLNPVDHIVYQSARIGLQIMFRIFGVERHGPRSSHRNNVNTGASLLISVARVDIMQNVSRIDHAAVPANVPLALVRDFDLYALPGLVACAERDAAESSGHRATVGIGC